MLVGRTLLCICVFAGSLYSQKTYMDSTAKSVNLNEVCILVDSIENEKAFSFYKSNRLAGTEDILARMPGVNLTRRGPYGQEPGLRNYSGSQTNLVIDGMRMYGACTDKMDPVSIYIEPANLEEIEVRHGAGQSMAGSSIGGEIEMNMRRPKDQCRGPLRGVLAQSYMSVNNAYLASISLEKSFHRWAYRVSGTYRKARDYKAGSDSLIKHSAYSKSNVSAAVVFRPTENHQLKLDLLGDWGRNIGYPALPMDVGRADAGIFSLAYLNTFKSSLFRKNELKLYYNQVYHIMDDTQRPDAPMHMDMPGWSNTLGAYDELSLRGKCILRLDFHRAYTRADMIMYPPAEAEMYMQTLPENQLYDLGLALDKSFDFRARQSLGLHFRADYYLQAAIPGPGAEQWTVYRKDVTLIKSNVLKNAGLSYSKSLFRKTKLRFSLAYGERLPSSNERYGYYLYNRQDQYDYIGNPDLDPEQSAQVELRLDQKGTNLGFWLNVFYHHNKNYIYAYRLDGFSQMTIGAMGLKTYSNIPYAISQGFEAGSNWNILQGLEYLANAKFVYAQSYDGKALPLVPPFKLQHALRYRYGLYQFQLEQDYAAAQNRVNSDFGDKVTPAFTIFNIRASINVAVCEKILQINLACENLFNRLYHEHLDIGQVPRFGRNIQVALNFIF